MHRSCTMVAENGLSNGVDGNILEEQADLYDRQIRLWGVDTQKRWAAEFRLRGELVAADRVLDAFHLSPSSCIYCPTISCVPARSSERHRFPGTRHRAFCVTVLRRHYHIPAFLVSSTQNVVRSRILYRVASQ